MENFVREDVIKCS